MQSNTVSPTFFTDAHIPGVLYNFPVLGIISSVVLFGSAGNRLWGLQNEKLFTAASFRS